MMIALPYYARGEIFLQDSRDYLIQDSKVLI